jgi:outer membrane protein OmpA-like peptidoglycan-associated protein
MRTLWLLCVVAASIPGSARAEATVEMAHTFADVLAAEGRAPRELRFDAIVTFERGSTRVYSASRERLQRLARAWQKQVRWGTITVDGSGSGELAQRRADKIRGYLLRYGIAADRVIAIGRGSSSRSRVDLAITLCERGCK